MTAKQYPNIDQTANWDTNNHVGTHKGTYSYDSLRSNGYISMKITCPDDNSSPVPDTPAQDLSDINPGLRNLTSSSYAKVFTLTSGRYDVYRDSSLTTKLSSTAWTGEDDEDWITGVGKIQAEQYMRVSPTPQAAADRQLM